MIVAPFTDQHAEAILAWHYEPPYDYYDIANDPDELDMLRNPARRPGLRAVVEDGELVGYFNFLLKGDEVHVGLGLRPDLTGQGRGAPFVEAGLAYARAEWAPENFRLWVAAFNARAIRAYERVGFVHVQSSCRLSDRLEFVEMERPA